MTRIRSFAISFIIALFFSHGTTFANEPPPSDAVYIIFDASGSMWQKLAAGDLKIEVARKVLAEFVADDFSGYELAFRAYGHRRKGDCRDSELVVPFAEPEKALRKLGRFMKTVNPTGKTPIHYSLLQALKDLEDRRGEIILISDGEETCDADPCSLIRMWREKNVKIRVHVVGFGLDEKSKAAMQCLADAAGTPYHDAGNASELADGIRKINKTTALAALVIRSNDAQGKRILVHGTLSHQGEMRYEVSSNGRFRVEPGEYDLLVGVRTKNGALYKPITKKIKVAATGETVVKVTPVRPPSVKAKFIENGKEIRGQCIVYGWQAGKEVLKFRWMDEAFVDEGQYEFRAEPNAFNKLSVTESFVAGDHKEIVFTLLPTVRIYAKMVASGSGIWFRKNYELWQDGRKLHSVHTGNGARVLPGMYDLHLPDAVTPWVHRGLEVTAEPEQKFTIEVPAGHVTIVYHKADGTRDKDDRCFMSGMIDGKFGRSKYTNSGEPYPLVPGRYRVEGWRHKGAYDPVEFTLKAGEDKEVVLRAKK